MFMFLLIINEHDQVANYQNLESQIVGLYSMVEPSCSNFWIVWSGSTLFAILSASCGLVIILW